MQWQLKRLINSYCSIRFQPNSYLESKGNYFKFFLSKLCKSILISKKISRDNNFEKKMSFDKDDIETIYLLVLFIFPPSSWATLYQ